MNFLTGIGGSFVTSLFGWLTGDLAGMLTFVGDVISHAGATSTIGEAVAAHYPHVVAVAPMVAAVAVPLGVISEFRGGVMWRPLIYVAVGALLVSVAPACATLVLRAIDGIGSMVTPNLASQIDAASRHLDLGALTPTGAVVGVITLIAGVIVSFELVIRSVVLVVVICVAPLVAAALSWLPARRLMVRLVEGFVAVAFAKLIVELALAVGVTLLALQRGVDLSLLAGATLCVAAFLPFVVIRLIPLGDVGMVSHLDGLRQRLVRSVGTSPQHPVAQVAMNALPVQPPPVPTTPDDLGLEMWPGEPERPLPDRKGPPPRPPVQPIRFPRRPVIRDSDSGPRIEWEWDDE